MAGETKNIYSATTHSAVSIAANIASGYVAGNNSVIDFTGDNYVSANAVLTIGGGFASAPTPNTTVELWMVRQDIDSTSDATNGGGVTTTPASPSGFSSTDGAECVGGWPLANSASTQRIICQIPLLGVQKATFFIRNQSGQQINAGVGTELTVKITPFTVGPA